MHSDVGGKGSNTLLLRHPERTSLYVYFSIGDYNGDAE